MTQQNSLSEYKLIRKYIPQTLTIENWSNIQPYFEDLINRDIHSANDLETWLVNRSELDAIIEEEMAWRYIRMNGNTTDSQLAERFNYFVNEIEPQISIHSNKLDEKLVANEWFEKLPDEKYFVPKRSIRKRHELFREINVPLYAKLQTLEQDYGRITGVMTIQYQNEELTLPKASNFLKNTDRGVREKLYKLIQERRIQDKDELNELLTKLIDLRQEIATNTGFDNYRDFKFNDMGRFDYTPNDCINFHQSIEKQVCPIVEGITQNRLKMLRYEELKPWDLEVDPDLKEPLKPFTTIDELVDKTIECFTQIRPQYGKFIKIMKENGYLDLDARKSKAPGGFNYPLYESNIPFIYMNATNNLRDLETMVHEGGHAIHSFLTKDFELLQFKDTPAEIAELASMSMELISMEHWDVFFDTPEELNRAKRSQLEGVISVLPWVATVDEFQHWLYLNKSHTIEQRTNAWKTIANKYSSNTIVWDDCEKYKLSSFQKQLHIYEVPFYYIEYGISQLGAIAVWRNYKQNKEKALDAYEKALTLGYSKTIPEIYNAAGIKFDFSENYIKELMNFVKEELNKLYTNI